MSGSRVFKMRRLCFYIKRLSYINRCKKSSNSQCLIDEYLIMGEEGGKGRKRT